MYRIKTKDKQRKYKRIVASAAVAGVLASMSILLGGCHVPGISTLTGGGSYVFKVGSEKCSEKDAKIILLNFQKEYSSLYGIDMWSHDYSEEGSLEDYVKDLTVSQLAEVYTLDVIADEQELTLSEEEQKKAQEAAQEYYSGLSSDEKDYLGAGESDVQSLYERYLLARKLYSELTGNVAQEVSDDEARVMEMQQICVSDESVADNIVMQLSSGAEFSALAASYNEAEMLNLHVTRTTFSSDVTKTLFALNNGEYSGVTEINGAYYIFYCVNSFNPDLTEQNKASVLEQRMEDAVNSTYASYAEELESSLNEKEWNKVQIDTSLELSGASFLDVYDSYFENME